MANDRFAGRKRKFNDDNINKMISLLCDGYKVKDIAKIYNTSRQVIARYINEKKSNYILKLFYMNKNRINTIIYVDYINKKVKIQNRTNDNLERAFGVIENPTFKQYENFLESRCVPRNRTNIKYLLRDIGLDNYDPIQIIKKTNGKLHGDPYYIKIK